MEKISNLYGQEWIEGITEGFTCPVCQKEASTTFNIRQEMFQV
jgi:hypothetical protein